MPLNKDSQILSDFRGMPYFPTFSKNRKTGGQPLKAASLTNLILQTIKAKHSKTSALENLSQNWHICAGTKFADKSFVYNIKGNVVFVSAINSQIKQMISFSEKKILANITKIEGCENITKIRFV